MNEEEKLILNTYIDNLYQAMLTGDIVFEPKHSSELYGLIIKLLEKNQQLKQQLEECQLQNSNLIESIIIKKISFQNEKIKDKSLLELYNMPSYEELQQENKQLKQQLEERDNIINKAREILEQYRHYTVPDEKQNKENENIVDMALEILNIDKGDKQI